MTLHIKDPEACELARKIAEQTGETMTRVITVALRERLLRLAKVREREAMSTELLAIGRRCAATLKNKPANHAALLHDENGLPK
jgi:antitoxin VapB